MKPADAIFVGRPILLIPLWTISLHFLTVASRGRGGIDIHTDLYALAGLTLIMMGAYIINQVFDIETDRINDKLYLLPRGIISVRAAWALYVVFSMLGLAITFAFVRNALWPCLLTVVLGIAYSVPGVRLKDYPVAGLLANAVTFGFLAPACVAPDAVTIEYGRPVIPYFLAVTTVYILTTIPDMAGDAATGKKTVAVVLGPKRTLWLALVTAILTVWTAVFSGNAEVAVIAGITAALVVASLISFESRLLLAACKAPILLLTLAAAYHFPAYLILLALTIVLTRVYYKNRFGIIYPRLW